MQASYHAIAAMKKLFSGTWMTSERERVTSAATKELSHLSKIFPFPETCASPRSLGSDQGEQIPSKMEAKQ